MEKGNYMEMNRFFFSFFLGAVLWPWFIQRRVGSLVEIGGMHLLLIAKRKQKVNVVLLAVSGKQLGDYT